GLEAAEGPAIHLGYEQNGTQQPPPDHVMGWVNQFAAEVGVSPTVPVVGSQLPAMAAPGTAGPSRTRPVEMAELADAPIRYSVRLGHWHMAGGDRVVIEPAGPRELAERTVLLAESDRLLRVAGVPVPSDAIQVIARFDPAGLAIREFGRSLASVDFALAFRA